MIKQLSPVQRKWLRKSRERQQADLTREQFFREESKTRKATINKFRGITHHEVHIENIILNEKCTPEEAEAIAIGSMYGCFLEERGLIRRIVENRPSELSCALSLASRLDWVEGRPHHCELYTNIKQILRTLAEIANHESPSIISEFNIRQPLPWDKNYYAWLRRKNRSQKYLDLSRHSELLTSWVRDLETPSWWK